MRARARGGTLNDAPSGSRVELVDVFADFDKVREGQRREAKLHREATECRLDFRVACEFTALSLCEAFKDVGEVGGIDFLGLSLVACQGQHRAGDLILTVRREPAHCLECFFQKLGHAGKVRPRARFARVKWRGAAGPTASAR